MAHNRKLVIGSVAMTRAKLKRKLAGPAMDRVRDDLERIIIESGFLDSAPFQWIGLVIREGLQDENEPTYERINKRYGDLPVAIEIDVHQLLDASSEKMECVYRRASLRALIGTGMKYELPAQQFIGLLSEIDMSD